MFYNSWFSRQQIYSTGPLTPRYTPQINDRGTLMQMWNYFINRFQMPTMPMSVPLQTLQAQQNISVQMQWTQMTVQPPPTLNPIAVLAAQLKTQIAAKQTQVNQATAELGQLSTAQMAIYYAGHDGKVQGTNAQWPVDQAAQNQYVLQMCRDPINFSQVMGVLQKHPELCTRAGLDISKPINGGAQFPALCKALLLVNNSLIDRKAALGSDIQALQAQVNALAVTP